MVVALVGYDLLLSIYLLQVSLKKRACLIIAKGIAFEGHFLEELPNSKCVLAWSRLSFHHGMVQRWGEILRHSEGCPSH